MRVADLQELPAYTVYVPEQDPVVSTDIQLTSPEGTSANLERGIRAVSSLFDTNSYFVTGNDAYCTDVLGAAKISYGLALGGVSENPEGRTEIILYMSNMDTSPFVPQGADITDPFFPRFWSNRIHDPFKVPKKFQSKNPHLNPGTAMIFAIDMGDIFGLFVPGAWIWDLMDIVRNCEQIFQILTKFPDNMLRWARLDSLPHNVWAGVSVCNQLMAESAVTCLSQIDAAVKYICVEPLLERIVLDVTGVDWMIIGVQTNPLVLPEKEWVEEECPLMNLLKTQRL